MDNQIVIIHGNAFEGFVWFNFGILPMSGRYRMEVDDSAMLFIPDKTGSFKSADIKDNYKITKFIIDN